MQKVIKRIVHAFLCILAVSLLSACSNTSPIYTKSKQWMQIKQKDNSFWASMRQDFTITCDANNPCVKKQIDWYRRHPKHLHHALKNSERFIHYVYQQTHEQHLPAELALIPLIESQYNPGVKARSGASGMWQIMPKTATKYGLKMDHSYDGRKDVTASTKAALDYLNYLHQYFKDDWLLALAAYDAGEGRVRSVMRKKNLATFWGLPLKKETQVYVPKLLAIALIIKDPAHYNLTLPEISKDSSLQKIAITDTTINMDEIAKNAGVDRATLHFYNPAIRKTIATVPSSLTLLVPDKNANLPPIIEEKTETTRTSKHRRYKIKSGDNLAIIAKKYHTSVAHLKKINHIRNEKHLKPGHKIIIKADS